MAKMVFGDELKAKADAGHIITVQEPACGAGCMVVAAGQALKEIGIDPARQAHFTMFDVDKRCVQAAYIQTTLCGISADVIHGNTLSLETWGSYRTITAMLHPKDYRIKAQQDAVPRAEIPEPSPTVPKPDSAVRSPLQLTFADI
jgi:hypothetical protein